MKRMILAVAAASMSASAVAAPPPEPDRLQWEVKWDETQCSLTRSGTGAHPFSFLLALSPASRLMFLQLIYEGPAPSMRGRVVLDLVFSPGDVRVPVDFGGSRTDGRNDLLTFTKVDILDRLAGARSLTFAEGSRSYLTIDLGESGKAVAGLRACRADILREWGVDSAALDALRQLPEIQTPPSDLLAHHRPPKGDEPRAPHASLLTRLDVTSDGHVSGCTVVRGSQGAEKDAKVCDQWRRNARFKPAVGADGGPAAATIVADYIWRTP
ncbi:MAG: hypothetical protein QOE79_2300 [Sphingomonadales bacterium]|nr:hypothetical protein [Sphingomonadales bacterium]MEA3049900.1 hypothetical protein [Sphingomonadales bacterium]